MTKTLAKKERSSKPGLVVKLAFLQLVVTIVFSLVLSVFYDSREALSFAFGGGIAATATLFFAGRLFTTKQDAEAQEILFRFYFSEAFKVIFTLAMMAICIIVLKVSILPFIIAYLIAAVGVNWLFLLLAKS